MVLPMPVSEAATDPVALFRPPIALTAELPEMVLLLPSSSALMAAVPVLLEPKVEEL